MDNQNNADIQDYVAMFRRRRRIIFWTSLFCLITALVLAFGIPPLYISKGTIMIENAEFSDDIVRTTIDVNTDTNLSIQRITDYVLTPENLSDLIVAHGLYPDLRSDGSDSEARRELKSSIEVVVVTAEEMPLGSDSEETIAFDIIFFHPIAEKARDVARDLVALYIEGHRERRTALALDTIHFLETEAEKLEESISETESALAKFKQEYAGALPELMDMNLQVMERTERELDLVGRDIRLQQQNKNLLTSELSQIDPDITVYTEYGRPIQGNAERLKTLEREYVRISSLYSSEHPDRIRVEKEIAQLRDSGSPSLRKTALQAEIRTKRDELRQLRERYSDDHPDVVKLERLLYDLEFQFRSLPVSASPANVNEAPSNPEYISVKVRLDAVNQELSALYLRRENLRRKLSELESRVMLTPQVEKEYSELTRDYELGIKKYNEIKNKQNLAQINLSIESEQKGVRFAVYKNPGLASKPVRPNRPVIIIAALVVAVAMSIGLAVATEIFDTTMRGRLDVQSIWEAAPIAVIPYVHNPADRVAQSLRYSASSVALALWAGSLYTSLQLFF